MAEQMYQPETMYPAEGRFDVAGDLEEEQRNAYSAHHSRPSSQKGKAGSPKAAGEQEGYITEGEFQRLSFYPAEGRADVADGLEEEERDSYSSHHQRH